MSKIDFIANVEVTILQSNRNATNDEKVKVDLVIKQIHLQELCTVRNIEQVLQVVRSVRNTNMADFFSTKSVPGQRVYLREDLVPD